MLPRSREAVFGRHVILQDVRRSRNLRRNPFRFKSDKRRRRSSGIIWLISRRTVPSRTSWYYDLTGNLKADSHVGRTVVLFEPWAFALKLMVLANSVYRTLYIYTVGFGLSWRFEGELTCLRLAPDLLLILILHLLWKAFTACILEGLHGIELKTFVWTIPVTRNTK